MEKKDSLKSALSDVILLVDELSRKSIDAEDRKIYGMYLTQAALILAKIEKGKNCDDDISEAERLFGQTQLKDGNAYATLQETWTVFTRLFTQPSLEGMTLNERIFALGLIDQFDDALERRDDQKLKAILEQCMFEDSDIMAIIKRELREED